MAHLSAGGDGEQEKPMYLSTTLVSTAELDSWSQKGIEYIRPFPVFPLPELLLKARSR